MTSEHRTRRAKGSESCALRLFHNPYLWCAANVPLHVTRSKRGKGDKGKQLVIHMRAAGYDTCSYGDYK